MIKAIHIEDEPRNIQLLQSLLDKFCAGKVQMLGVARSIDDGKALIENVNPQLVFLDIELNGGTAFDLLEEFPNRNFKVIFITAYNQYAVNAFRVAAVDYLLKPIGTKALVESVSRMEQELDNMEKIRLQDKVLKQEFEKQNSRISVTMPDGKMFIDCNSICKIEAQGSYTHVFIDSGKKILVTGNLKNLMHQLPEVDFKRVHHSWVVNKNFIKKYFAGKNGYIELKDNSKVPVSVKKKTNFLNEFY